MTNGRPSSLIETHTGTNRFFIKVFGRPLQNICYVFNNVLQGHIFVGCLSFNKKF